MPSEGESTRSGCAGMRVSEPKTPRSKLRWRSCSARIRASRRTGLKLPPRLESRRARGTYSSPEVPSPVRAQPSPPPPAESCCRLRPRDPTPTPSPFLLSISSCPRPARPILPILRARAPAASIIRLKIRISASRLMAGCERPPGVWRSPRVRTMGRRRRSANGRSRASAWRNGGDTEVPGARPEHATISRALPCSEWGRRRWLKHRACGTPGRVGRDRGSEPHANLSFCGGACGSTAGDSGRATGEQAGCVGSGVRNADQETSTYDPAAPGFKPEALSLSWTAYSQTR